MFSRPLLFVCFIASSIYLSVKYNEKLKYINTLKELFYDLTISPSGPIFTLEELSAYTGENEGPIYLSILGNVFDVTKGRKHYAKGETYSIFAGRDASKAFITGDFSDAGLTDDISELTINELGDLNGWLEMYEKDYDYKGKLIGRFYDRFGNPTPYLDGIRKKLLELDRKKKVNDNFKFRFPPCNVEWTPETGSRFWCSKQSGGISRSWTGVPHKFYQPGSKKHRCACVNLIENENPEGKFLPYEDCPPDSSSCYVKLSNV